MSIETILISFVAVTTVSLSIITKVIGFPIQIRRLRATKDSSSFSLLLFTLLPLTQIFWLIHGIILKDWVLIVSSIFGVAVTFTLLLTILKYRKTQR